MKRYLLHVDVKLTEVMEPEPIEMAVPGADPTINQIGKMLGNVMTSPIAMMGAYGQPGGIEWRKSASITAGSFQTIAKILEQFEELTNEISLERV